MKKFAAFLSLLIFSSSVIAAASAPNIARAGLDISKKSAIIPRSEWGANEEILFRIDDNTAQQNEETEFDETEQSEIENDDPEIANVETRDESGREYIWPLQYAKRIKFIVIHHTASEKNLDDPKTALKNIQYYHAVRRRWGDIGYNYIIDTDGNIYEGRKGGEKIIAGHAAALNKVSIGIAVLGNYEKNELPLKALKSLIGLVAEKTKLHRIDVDGKSNYKDKNYNAMQGHYENAATLCPGKNLKNKLDAVRRLVAYINAPLQKARPEKYDFSDFEPRDIITALPGEKKEFTIKLRNRGEVAWREGTFLENIFDATDDGLPKIMARLEDKEVAPNQVGTFKGSLPENLESGFYVPELSLVINGSIRPQKSFPAPIMVEDLRITYEIAGRLDPPNIMQGGRRAEAWIKLKNTGNVTWKRSGTHRVSIVAARPDDRKSLFFEGKNKISRLVEKEVRPGEIGTFTFNLKAPKISGTFKEYFQPAMEGVPFARTDEIFRMEDSGMHFTIKVKAKEPALRVLISKASGKKPQIRSSSSVNLYEDKKLIHEFGPNEIVTIASLKNGKYRVRTAEKRFTLASPPRLKARNNEILEIVNYENRPEWNKNLNDNMFRGMLEVQKIDGELQVINELPLEDYLKGIAEISNADRTEKIKTIIILARSYAKYYRDIGEKFPGKPYHLDDDPERAQKYSGYGLEARSPNIVAAVEETAGKIVTYEGQPVITPYFSQSDGRTRSAEEVWGWTFAPYLQSVEDNFCLTTTLHGHGVGLSGCGATELARQGKTAEEIIKYYYTGVEITD